MTSSSFSRIILATILALCFAVPAVRASDVFVLVEEIEGEADIQRAGQQKWDKARVGQKLFNNDMIRVGDESKARLKWFNGSRMYVHPNSQILINLYKNSSNDFISKHATVFFGAIFYVVKKTLPREFAGRFDSKVYTPTAVVSIRGTSFHVKVDKETGATQVGVINGTVLVGNILKKQSMFLSAGYQTTVTMNANPVQPVALVEKTIDGLKSWVPPTVIEKEMKKQLAAAQKTHYAITGKLEQKILVLPFQNASGYNGSWNIASLLPQYIAQRIKKDMSEMQIVQGKATTEALKAGADAGAKFVLTGEIKTFELTQRAEISVKADEYKEYVVARVKLLVQVIDVSTKSLLYEGEALGEVSGGNDWIGTWKDLQKRKFDLADPEFAKTIVAKATDQALDQSAVDMERYLKGH